MDLSYKFIKLPIYIYKKNKCLNALYILYSLYTLKFMCHRLVYFS